MKKTTWIFGLVLVLVIPSFSFAGFRCKGKTVRAGDTTTVVQMRCGQPFDRQYVGVEKIGNKWVTVERWTYDQGTGKFLKILEFHEGILAKIRNGPRM